MTTNQPAKGLLIDTSFINLTALVGAVVINVNGAEFSCVGFSLSADTFTVWMDLASFDEDGNVTSDVLGVPLNSSLAGWRICMLGRAG